MKDNTVNKWIYLFKDAAGIRPTEMASSANCPDPSQRKCQLTDPLKRTHGPFV